MTFEAFATMGAGQAIPRSQIPHLPIETFRQTLVDAVFGVHRVSAFFGDATAASNSVDLYAVLADRTRGTLRVAKTSVESDSFASLTPVCPQVHLFEREIAEQYGVRPEGHPWFKPVRFHASYRPGHDAWNRKPGENPIIGVTDYYRVEGEEIHEVAVGPVHAGIIEPGHFRFQCHGEHVFHLEISLGYQHRGVERSLIGGPSKRSVHMMEEIAGDTSIGHATAYCQNLESLGDCKVPMRGESLRAIALELERLANHTGDLGALAGDVGYLPTQSYCGRIRGDFLNLSALLCGSRFGRGLVRPGGVCFDLDADRRKTFLERLDSAYADVANAAGLLWESISVQARFEGAGTISPEVCLALGLVGPSARSCGFEYDVRRDFPTGIYQSAQITVGSWPTGDVYARAYVRFLEIQNSVAFIRTQVQALPEGPIKVEAGMLKPDHFAVSLIEGWRGEICHAAITDSQGKFARYKVVDPSFHNWTGLAMSLRDQQISDFPLCNKSFNLSYCGHDL